MSDYSTLPDPRGMSSLEFRRWCRAAEKAGAAFLHFDQQWTSLDWWQRIDPGTWASCLLSWMYAEGTHHWATTGFCYMPPDTAAEKAPPIMRDTKGGDHA